jgi:hypothetical protein
MLTAIRWAKQPVTAIPNAAAPVSNGVISP